MVIVKELTANDAREVLLCWQKGDWEPINEYVTQSGTGSPIDESAINSAVDAIQSICDEGRANKRERGIIDGDAATFLHSSLPNLDAATVGKAGFWRWLALANFYRVIEWRHHRDEGAHPNNYGIGNRWTNYPARLWFRADLSYDEHSQDPYELTKRGPVDFWESGIIRHNYASCRCLARAFVRYQYPGERLGRPRLHLVHENGVRLLYKRLRRLHATVAFEILNDDEAYELLLDLGHGLEEG